MTEEQQKNLQQKRMLQGVFIKYRCTLELKLSADMEIKRMKNYGRKSRLKKKT